jgi:outer membrane protein assembly factor BamE (lipoprotein component of BamABCDE complex)
MKSIYNIFCIFVFIGAVSGCMTPGQQLDTKAIQQLHEGQTQGEVRAIFGKPVESVSDGNGNALDVFQFTSPKSISEGRFRTIEFRSLHVLYNSEGRVKKFVPHVGELKGYIGRDNKWRAGRPFEPGKLNTIQRGLTTHDELIRLFGPATIEGVNVQGNAGARWYFGEGKGLNETRRRELSVLFDVNSVVTDFITRDLED